VQKVKLSLYATACQTAEITNAEGKIMNIIKIIKNITNIHSCKPKDPKFIS